ncbi:E3 ubiquitin protein ligase UPL1-like protein [Tanacetum coccineum]
MEGDSEPNSGDYHALVRETTDVHMNDNSQIAQSDETDAASVAPNENGIDPTFLEALPEDLRAEVLASQQARSTPAPAVSSLQAEGQPVDMDNASIITTFLADLRHEKYYLGPISTLNSAVHLFLGAFDVFRISSLALTIHLLRLEAQMLRDRAMSHYHARSLAGSNHRVFTWRIGARFDRQTIISESLKGMEVDGEPLLDADGLKGLVRLLRLAQPLAKGLLQRLFLNLSAHGCTRENIVNLLLNMIKPETEGPVGRLTKGIHKDYMGVSPMSSSISIMPDPWDFELLGYKSLMCSRYLVLLQGMERFLKEKKFRNLMDEIPQPDALSMEYDVPMLLFTELLNHLNIDHLEQVLGLLHVVVYNAASKLDCNSPTEPALTNSKDLPSNEAAGHPQEDSSVVYTLTRELLKKLASFAPLHRKFFIVELLDLARSLSSKAVQELITLRNTYMLGLSTRSMAGSSVLRIPQILDSLTLVDSNNSKGVESDGNQEHVTLRQELSDPSLPLGSKVIAFYQGFLGFV